MVIGSITAPTREDYTFAGWYTAADGGSLVINADGTTFAAPVDGYTGTENSTTVWKITENTTLYAHWTAETYNVTLSAAGATTAGDASFTATYDAAVPSFTAPKRTGYTLTGWYTASTDGVKVLNADGTAANDGTYTKDGNWVYDDNGTPITLYAQWTAKEYTLTFNSQDGSNATTRTVAYASGGPIYAPSARTGYTFLGWYDAASGGEQVFDTNGMLNNDTAYTTGGKWDYDNDLTLYAHWQAHTTTVTLDANSGTLGATKNFAATYDAALGITIAAPSLAGYTFAGWTATKDSTDVVVNVAGTAYAACAGVTSSDETPVWKVDAATYTLYAKWTADSQTVTLPADNTVTVSSPTTTGTKVTLTVTPPTGKKIGSLLVRPGGDGDPITITPATYAADDSKQTFTYTQPASPVTVTVTYENINYTVSYVVPASVTVSGASTSYTVDSTSFTIPGAFTRTGFTFGGWTISRPEGSAGTVNGGSNTVAAGVTSIALDKATGNITLTAKWEATSNQLHFAIKDKNAGANDVGHLGTATYSTGTGIMTGTGNDDGKYFITADSAATFTVTPKPGYKVTSVTYADVNDDGTVGTATEIAGTGSSYTIPAAACAVPLIVTVNTALDSSKISVNANIEGGAFQHYSLYSGTKSLVRIHVDSSVSFTGIAFSSMSAYRTDAYSGYEYAALIDLSEVSDKTQTDLLAYIQSIMEFSSTANTVLKYDKDVNGNGDGFKIDDISVEYDYTSYSTLKWAPLDAYLIIGDIAGNGTSVSDGVLNSYDVAAFVAAYK